MERPNLNSALRCYETTLAVLESKTPEITDEIIFDVLIARDRLQMILADSSLEVGRIPLAIHRLDQKLRKHTHIIQSAPLSDWRAIIKPSEEAWWWFLYQPKSETIWQRFDWLWEVLTFLILIINFSFVVEISSRLLSGGPDFLGSFTIVGQIILALIAAGGALTDTGQKFIKHALKDFGIPAKYWHEVKLVGVVIVLIILLLIQVSLPRLSQHYVQKAIVAEKSQFSVEALKNYERAIQIDPENLEAYHRLGAIHEQLSDLTQAKEKYQVSMLGNCVESLNNLGRLYIIEDNDYSAASILLAEGQSLMNRENSNDYLCLSETNVKKIQYVLAKNLGWARLKQERFSEAEAALKRAIELNDKQADSHCLMAQLLENRDAHSEDKALIHWEQCANFANKFNIDHDEWFKLAQERLLLYPE